MIVRPNLLYACLARGGDAGTLSVSRIRDGVLLWQGEHAHQGPITRLEWAPGGTMLASAGQDGMVRVWDTLSGDLLRSFWHGEEVRQLRWSAQGTLAAVTATAIHLWPLGALASASSDVA
jgi:WD40 repeat protein